MRNKNFGRGVGKTNKDSEDHRKLVLAVPKEVEIMDQDAGVNKNSTS